MISEISSSPNLQQSLQPLKFQRPKTTAPKKDRFSLNTRNQQPPTSINSLQEKPVVAISDSSQSTQSQLSLPTSPNNLKSILMSRNRLLTIPSEGLSPCTRNLLENMTEDQLKVDESGVDKWGRELSVDKWGRELGGRSKYEVQDDLVDSDDDSRDSKDNVKDSDDPLQLKLWAESSRRLDCRWKGGLQRLPCKTLAKSLTIFAEAWVRFVVNFMIYRSISSTIFISYLTNIIKN